MSGLDRSSKPISWEAIALSTLAALRFLLPFAPDRLFDVDPASVEGPFPAVGPSGAAFLDAVILLIAAVALWRESRRDGLDPWLVALGLAPLPVLIFHGSIDLLDAWRGLDWFAAAMLGLALLHLVRIPVNRRIVFSVMLGAIGAGGIRGFQQVFWEHAQTVAFFDANRELVLGARGWAEDSSAALAFERRLRQPEATGWTGFSNVFSGFCGAAAVALAGIVFARRRDASPLPVPDPPEGAGGLAVVGLAAIGSAMLVGINGSKGAIGATLLGVVVLAAAFGPARDLFRRRPGVPVFAAVAFLLALVVGRGMLGDDFAGERSLLFRWHYMVGSFGIIDAATMLGVGPDGFQEAYLAAKPPTSPENVASAHSMWLDWIASLGVLGLGWMGLAILGCARTTPGERGGDDSSGLETVPLFLVPLVIAGYIGYEQFRTEWPLDDVGLATRIAALAFGVIVGTGVWGTTRRTSPESLRAVGLAAAVVILAHAQIEMIFWQPTSMALAWVFLAAGGTAQKSKSPRWQASTRIVAVGLLAVTVLLAAAFSIRSRIIEGEVATLIEPLHRQAVGSDPATRAEREAVIAGLVDQVDATGWYDGRTARGAIDQWLIVGSPDAVRRAAEFADRWFEARPGAESAGIRSAVMMAVARTSEDLPMLDRALAAIDDAILFDPTEPRYRLARAEVLVRLGRSAEASTSIEEAERLDLDRGLDPLVQMGQSDRDRLESLRRAIAGE